MKDSKRPNFNSRIETVATHGLWKGAFASSRALFPMRGYFEWTGTAGNKQPHFLHAKDGGLLAAAGIYTARKVEDEWQVSASIITRPARDASGEIHDRMPVFLEAEVWDEYLSPDKLDGPRAPGSRARSGQPIWPGIASRIEGATALESRSATRSL